MVFDVAAAAALSLASAAKQSSLSATGTKL